MEPALVSGSRCPEFERRWVRVLECLFGESAESLR